MSEPIHQDDALTRYEQSKARLLDSLTTVDDMRPKAPPAPLTDHWATSGGSDKIHMKLVPPYRDSDFTFVMAHMEKGTVRTRSVPEDIVLQCLAGRFRVTNAQGHSWMVVAHSTININANEIYCYEAIEEVYNIMSVSTKDTMISTKENTVPRHEDENLD